MVWLHGTLLVKIESAVGIPTEARIEIMENRKLGRMISLVQQKIGLHKPSDAYCVINLGGSRRARTRVIEKQTNPQWNETFAILVADNVDDVTIDIKDSDFMGASYLGRIDFMALEILSGVAIDGWFTMNDPMGGVEETKVKLSIMFTPARNELGLRGDQANGGAVPDVYFPLHRGCHATLYHDAHQEPSEGALLANGRTFQNRSLWTDMYNDINRAKRFVYIAGWCVNQNIQLMRDPTRPQAESGLEDLGTLLIRKASEGVRVLVLVWADRTSFDSALFSREGVMGTQEKATHKYFKHTDVVCRLCPRLGGTEDSSSLNQRLQTGTFFTHHQKVVALDVTGADDVPRVVSYIGGVDLAPGRYDTGRHSLFRTQGFEHSDDYYQGCMLGTTWANGGPRQPWHDIHCRLEGPAARDVLHNFVQRWRKQGKTPDTTLLDLDTVGIPNVTSDPPPHAPQSDPRVLLAMDPADPESWNIQIFRSIDSDSVEGFPIDNAEATHLGLMSGKGKSIDFSIQRAYIHAIRRARHFIYIENQYFLGSSHLWSKHNDSGCIHLIPAELMLKIVSKIAAGERFTCYIVKPLYPEGAPDSLSDQEILRFQGDTMRMMYRHIAEALVVHKRVGELPTDYLSFFCLGNREAPLETDIPALNPYPPTSNYARSMAHRRFMIYVHSKLMIVDDEFIIIGSANINQRSMDGSRDTEIAMGSFQNSYLAGDSHTDLPKGQIYGLRMALWEEHMGGVVPLFQDPASVECMRHLRAVGDTNWGVFAAEETQDMASHLMTYPVHVTQFGRVEPLEGQLNIPDTDVPILGLTSGTLPDILTT